MMQSLKELFEKSLSNTLLTIPKQDYSFTQVNQDGVNKPYLIKPVQFITGLTNKFKDFTTFKIKYIDHLDGQKNIIAAFASTPVSFSDAWNMKSEELTSSDVLTLTKSGGHFQFNQIPAGTGQSGSGLYLSGYATGLVKSKGIALTKGFRHKTGGIYKQDSLNEMGVFTYATPTDAAGMMEYRFVEEFSKSIGIPLIFIITQWFRYDTKFEDLNSWLYMTGVAKVIPPMKRNHPHDPIKLQLISKDEAIGILERLQEAFQSKEDFKIRPFMPDAIKLGWSYPKIQGNKEKRNLVIKYALDRNFSCPGDSCEHIYFKDLQPSKIHIGHRISQAWNAQNAGVADIHHPYNLYLSCDKCNIGLSSKYPTQIDEIINEMGTIGDWLMKDLLENSNAVK